MRRVFECQRDLTIGESIPAEAMKKSLDVSIPCVGALSAKNLESAMSSKIKRHRNVSVGGKLLIRVAELSRS